MIKQFAKAVLLSQQLYEESYNGSTYTISLEEAAKTAVKTFSILENWAEIILILNFTAWNNIQLWSKKTINLY